MTPEQREQVVELLRCAADLNSPLDCASGLALSGSYAGASKRIRERASDAFVDVNGWTGDDWRASCLEAAQRVEDGEWP